MKFTPAVLLVLFLQIAPTNALFLCTIFGFIASLGADTLQGILNDSAAGEENQIEIGFPGYQYMQIDNFTKPEFQGCSFSAGAYFRFVSDTTVSSLDATGFAEVEGTLQLARFIFSIFGELCIEDLAVSDLEFDQIPGEGAEEVARAEINKQFENPQCFNEEEEEEPQRLRI